MIIIPNNKENQYKLIKELYEELSRSSFNLLGIAMVSASELSNLKYGYDETIKDVIDLELRKIKLRPYTIDKVVPTYLRGLPVMKESLQYLMLSEDTTNKIYKLTKLILVTAIGTRET